MNSGSAGGSRLGSAFKQGRVGLVPFLTAGYPSLEGTLAMLRGFERLGAWAVEIGVPFSDPIADGPEIQRSSEWALRRRISIDDTLGMIATYRSGGGLPIVVMTYANPVYRLGVEAFAVRARAVGVDGVLVSDLPPDESAEAWQAFDEAGLDTIVLIAPTTSSERLPRLVSRSRGFVYCLARTGVTGRSDGEPGSVDQRIQDIRRHSKLPVAVGFGISNPADAHRLSGLADAIVVGAAFMRAVAEDPETGAAERVLALGASFIDALGARPPS